MYAIIMAGGKQHRVEPGAVLDVDRIASEPGAVITLDKQVLYMHDDTGISIGNPILEGVAVDCEIVKHFRGEKLTVFKMKRRKRCRRKHGHRQELTQVLVKAIRKM